MKQHGTHNIPCKHLNTIHLIQHKHEDFIAHKYNNVMPSVQTSISVLSNHEVVPFVPIFDGAMLNR